MQSDFSVGIVFIQSANDSNETSPISFPKLIKNSTYKNILVKMSFSSDLLSIIFSQSVSALSSSKLFPVKSKILTFL